MKALDFAICFISWCKIYSYRFDCTRYLYLRLVAEKQGKYIQVTLQETVGGANFIMYSMFCFSLINITQTVLRYSENSARKKMYSVLGVFLCMENSAYPKLLLPNTSPSNFLLGRTVSCNYCAVLQQR